MILTWTQCITSKLHPTLSHATKLHCVYTMALMCIHVYIIMYVPPKPMELVLVLASWIREGEGALASNGFPTGFRPVRLELGPDGEDDRPNGFDGEGPEGTGCGLGGATVKRSRSTRLALVPRNCASILGSSCGERRAFAIGDSAILS